MFVVLYCRFLVFENVKLLFIHSPISAEAYIKYKHCSFLGTKTITSSTSVESEVTSWRLYLLVVEFISQHLWSHPKRRTNN